MDPFPLPQKLLEGVSRLCGCGWLLSCDVAILPLDSIKSGDYIHT